MLHQVHNNRYTDFLSDADRLLRCKWRARRTMRRELYAVICTYNSTQRSYFSERFFLFFFMAGFLFFILRCLLPARAGDTRSLGPRTVVCVCVVKVVVNPLRSWKPVSPLLRPPRPRHHCHRHHRPARVANVHGFSAPNPRTSAGRYKHHRFLQQQQ